MTIVFSVSIEGWQTVEESIIVDGSSVIPQLRTAENASRGVVIATSASFNSVGVPTLLHQPNVPLHVCAQADADACVCVWTSVHDDLGGIQAHKQRGVKAVEWRPKTLHVAVSG